MHTRLKELPDIRLLAGAPSPEDMAILRGSDYGGAELAETDVTVRAMLLAHDQTDRTFEKFPKPYLRRFAETIPGKSMLPGHDKSALPLGRFFRGDVTERQSEEFPVIAPRKKSTDEDVSEKAPIEIVPGFEIRKRTIQYLKAGFYYPSDAAAEAMDNRIRVGVYRSVSIGFRFDDLDCDVCKSSYFGNCPHILGQDLEDGKIIVTGTYSGDAQKAEALEGSIVFLGAQPGARLLKSMLHSGEIDVEKLAATPFGEDHVARKEAESLARQIGHKQKVWAVKPEENSSATAGETTGEAAASSVTTQEPPSVVPTGDTDMPLLEEARKRLGLADDADEAKVLAEIEEAVKAFKLKTDAEQSLVDAEKALATAKPFAEIGEKALALAAKEYVDNCIRLEQDETEAKAVAEMFVGRQDFDGLKGLAERKFEAVCKRFPAEPKGRVLDEETRSAPTRQPLPAHAYRA